TKTIAGLVHDDSADLLEPGRFIRGADQRLVASAEGAVRAIGPEQFRLRALALRDVSDRANAFDHIAGVVDIYLRHFPHPFQCAINNDAVLDVIRRAKQSGGPYLVDPFSVLRMDSAEEDFVGEGGSLRYSKDAKHFIRPGEAIMGKVEAPASDV